MSAERMDSMDWGEVACGLRASIDGLTRAIAAGVSQDERARLDARRRDLEARVREADRLASQWKS